MTQEEAERIMQKVEAILREEQKVEQPLELWAIKPDSGAVFTFPTQQVAEDFICRYPQCKGRIVRLKEVL